MATSRIKVKVTEADIARAHRNDSYTCVVSQAVARTVPEATRIEVDTQSVRFTAGGERLIYMTPYVVQGYIVAFDAGDEIAPFEFQLRDPKRVARKVRTSAGHAADRAALAARRTEAKKTKVATGAVATSKKTKVPTAPVGTSKNAVTAAYAEAAGDKRRTYSDKGGPKSPPRVFKKKTRSYGHRLLRINQDAA